MAKAKKKRKRSKLTYIVLGVVFVVGFAILSYPTFSDYWNSLHQTRAIMNYAEIVSGMSEEDYAVLLGAAEAYNRSIPERDNPYLLTEEQREQYEQLLNPGGTGIMGYIEIPVISVYLPIYHGTEESVLQTSIGHLEWTSLPVGGESTHTVLSGHRGLPSAKLFTDLDKLVIGDTFVLGILNEVLTYEVDQILIVLPEEIASLQITKGEDYCTLVTCTPYGINTHRLLVRGHRIENTKKAGSVRVTADAVQVEPVIVAPVLAVPLVLVVIVLQALDDKLRRSGRIRDDENDDLNI